MITKEKLKRFKNHPVFLCLLLGNLVFMLLIGIRGVGWLQPVELLTYDLGLQSLPETASDDRILLVGVTEEDIHRFGYPIPDETLADLLQILSRDGARAIGVDIYRDIPVPPGSDKLSRTLETNPNIVWIRKFGGKDAASIEPPKVLIGTDRYGFNDVVDDPGGIVRRALLFMDDGQNNYTSFPLKLALRYLEPSGTGLQADAEHPEFVRLGKTTIPPLESSSGGYVNLDASGYQFLIDYKGMPNRFKQFSIADVLDGKAGAGQLKDKIVIVGLAANSTNDFIYTPFSHERGAERRIWGIELHGEVTSQLLRLAAGEDDVIKLWQDSLENGWIWFWSILGCLLGFFIRSFKSIAVVSGAALILQVACGYFFFRAGWWTPFFPATLGFVLAAVAAISYMSHHERKERSVLMRIFSKHVSDDVAQAVWQAREQFLDGGRPKPQKLIATVLFTDIQGFTSISEKMEPEELMGWLNDYMEAMSRVIMSHHGVINKYIGDAIMAVFGIPIARTSESEIARDAENAVNCALAMQAEIIRLNELWASQGKNTISMRVGIYTGPLVAGSLGGAERMEYTVIGDTVNTASRLESFDKKTTEAIIPAGVCRILVGDTTLKLLDGKFDTCSVGSILLKGKEVPIPVSQIIGSAK